MRRTQFEIDHGLFEVKKEKLVEVKRERTGDDIAAEVLSKISPPRVKPIKKQSESVSRRRAKLRAEEIDKLWVHINELDAIVNDVTTPATEREWSTKEHNYLLHRVALMMKVEERRARRTRDREIDQQEARDRELAASLELAGLLQQEHTAAMPDSNAVNKVMARATGARVQHEITTTPPVVCPHCGGLLWDSGSLEALGRSGR